MNIAPASQNNFSAVVDLIRSSKLPVEDISSQTKLFAAEQNNNVIGTIGLEHDNENALLRSLSVTSNERKKGIGEELVKFVEDYARNNGIHTIYLLTKTAEIFFSKRGYQKIDRSVAPEFIQNTSEFSSVGCSSATVMKKQLL